MEHFEHLTDDKDCYYAEKFLNSFYNNELKQNDCGPLIIPHFPKIAPASSIHYKAFFKFYFYEINLMMILHGNIGFSSIVSIGAHFCTRLCNDPGDTKLLERRYDNCGNPWGGFGNFMFNNNPRHGACGRRAGRGGRHGGNNNNFNNNNTNDDDNANNNNNICNDFDW